MSEATERRIKRIEDEVTFCESIRLSPAKFRTCDIRFLLRSLSDNSRFAINNSGSLIQIKLNGKVHKYPPRHDIDLEELGIKRK